MKNSIRCFRNGTCSRRLPALLFVFIFTISCGQNEIKFEVPDTAGLRWFKGNTHAHTTMSDGDSSPEVVAKWYKNNGYQFLVLSDHNVLTNTETLNHLQDSTFLLIPGEELTTSYKKKPVHVNGLGLSRLIEPKIDSTLLGTIQKNVDAVREENSVPHINHPNFRWAFNHETLTRVRNYNLLEIFNGHPMVNNFSGGGWPGMEQVWDHLLTSGQRVYGIAVDDAHHFKKEFRANRSNPGRGWVQVRAHSLNQEEILRNLDAGWFYASTGVVLTRIIIQSKRIELHIQNKWDNKYRTEFIGSKGKVLFESVSNPAVFDLKDEKKYVRAKVYDSGGSVAWVQPVFVAQ